MRPALAIFALTLLQLSPAVATGTGTAGQQQSGTSSVEVARQSCANPQTGMNPDGLCIRMAGANPANSPGGPAEAAFNSAKELGTAEAWTAFLANYPAGFYSDLAKAYLKQVGGQSPAPQAAPLPPPPQTQPTATFAQELSCSQQATLRSLASQVPAKVTFVNTSGMYRSINWIDFNGAIKDYGGMNSGEERTIESFETHPWVIATGPGDCLQIFLPAAGVSRIELRALAADRPPVQQYSPPQRVQEREYSPPPKKKTLVCGKNYKLRRGECVLIQNCGSNAYRSSEGDCYCKKNYEMRKGRCVWKTDKQGFEVAPWEKKGCKSWEKQCSQGNNNACGQYEANCQVN